MIKGGSTQQFASPEEALAHYGVKGMHWGERKEEETHPRESAKLAPLSEKKQQKVDKFLQRADVMGAHISDLTLENEAIAGSRNPAKRYVKYANNQSIRQLEKSQQKALKDAEAVKKGKLTSGQKRAIVGGVLVATLVVGGMVFAGQQSGAFNQAKLLGQARVHGSKTPFELNHELSKSMSASDLLNKVAKPVNPGYSKAGGKMNCRRSTYAYELRRRGFDVHATTSGVGWGQSESGVINAVTPGSRNFYRSTSVSTMVQKTGAAGKARGDIRSNPLKKTVLDGLIEKAGLGLAGGGDPVSSSRKVLDELAKQPNGSRGEVLFRFPTFGHSMAYEIVDGKPHIFDSQKGTLYTAAKRVESKWDGFHSAEITRLDNADLDLSFLTRWATNNPRGK